AHLGERIVVRRIHPPDVRERHALRWRKRVDGAHQVLQVVAPADPLSIGVDAHQSDGQHRSRYSFNFRSSRAGLPPTSVNGGTSDVTTDAAATTAPRPMCTPLRIVLFAPIQTSS